MSSSFIQTSVTLQSYMDSVVPGDVDFVFLWIYSSDPDCPQNSKKHKIDRPDTNSNGKVFQVNFLLKIVKTYHFKK